MSYSACKKCGEMVPYMEPICKDCGWTPAMGGTGPDDPPNEALAKAHVAKRAEQAKPSRPKPDISAAGVLAAMASLDTGASASNAEGRGYVKTISHKGRKRQIGSRTYKKRKKRSR